MFKKKRRYAPEDYIDPGADKKAKKPKQKEKEKEKEKAKSAPVEREFADTVAIQTLRTGEVEVGTLLVAAVREIWEDGLLVALPFHLLGEVPADHTVDLPDFEARGADT